MRTCFHALLLGGLMLTGCKAQEETSIDYSVEIPALDKQSTPSSKRSQKAIEQVAPRLITELKAKDLEFGALKWSQETEPEAY